MLHDDCTISLYYLYEGGTTFNLNTTNTGLTVFSILNLVWAINTFWEVISLNHYELVSEKVANSQ